ncbi:MAG: phosphodiesterase [Clostridia bacterium]|nr:phosphodiesterase [Clostridia bacterium]MCD8309275.1 phosphodiesterase [Clostridia bacterium]
MKLFIASDLHGSAKYCRLMAAAFEREKAEKLVLLGDILYHGPRNGLPEEYDPKEVIAILTQYKDKIMCVRGNCDAEIDQMVLPFPILSEYGFIYANGVNIYLSHGHRDVPPLGENDVYITGHTHVPVIEHVGYLHLNPGSVSIPKENSEHGYIVFENRTFTFKTLEGKEYKQVTV